MSIVKPNYFALIPCAGSGDRAGGGVPKQYQLLQGIPMVFHALSTLSGHPLITSTVLVLAPDDTMFDVHTHTLSAQFDASRWYACYCGGETRHISVLQGLDQLAQMGASEQDWVLVHDAARPGLTRNLLDRLITTVGMHPVGGILAMPVSDTLKRAHRNKTEVSVQTLMRDNVWQAQTPQMFRFGLLRHALRFALQDNQQVTDESHAMELCGHHPLLVQGGVRNFKVTYAHDFALAQILLNAQDL